jgi:hypothetical protein
MAKEAKDIPRPSVSEVKYFKELDHYLWIVGKEYFGKGKKENFMKKMLGFAVLLVVIRYGVNILRYTK